MAPSPILYEMMQNKDADAKNVLRFLWMMWWGSIAVLACVVIICHLFADWAMFAKHAESEFLQLLIGKPVIVLLNTCFILSIIACLRFRTMNTAQRRINHLKTLADAALLKDSAVLDVYRRSIVLSIVIGALIAVCGGVGFFLSHDYFILYLFVFIGHVFLIINRPRQVEIEKVKDALEAHTEGAITPEKKKRIGKKIQFAFLLVLLFPATCTYLEYRNVDPEGACKGYKNIGICMLALYEAHYFSPLPSDDEMIEHFERNRQEFENMAKYETFSERDNTVAKRCWKYGWAKPNIRKYEKFCRMPQDIYSTQEKGISSCFSGDRGEWAYALEMERTIYILDADYSWPHNSHEKGYVYFPIAPKIENGRVIGPKMKDGPRMTWRLFDTLDNTWPTDMERNEYILKQIEPQWFLYISKDHIGG